MPGYEPIEPVEVVAARLGIPAERVVKLDGNENPYGAAPGVAAALRRYAYHHIYPDPAQRRVREAVAAYVDVDPEQVVLGNGSDELLDLAARLLLSPGDTVVDAPPSFGMYEFLARVHGARLVEIPRLEEFSLDLSAMEAALSDGAKLVFLASPNNPTGNPLPQSQLERLLAHRAVVLVDEAYAEFAGESFVKMVGRHDNLIVVRTFSKWAGLAGLRAGYGVFPRPIADVMHKIKMPYNLSTAAEVAVLASLEEAEFLNRNVKAIVAERERLRERLAALGWIRPYPSRANFLLCEVRGAPAAEVRDGLRERGILVRHFDVPGLRNCLRISVGKPEHGDRLLEALAELAPAGKG